MNPPGSTFKVITAYGLLTAGMRPNTEVGCPASLVVGGREFSNAGNVDLGEITLGEALAASCNTTFAQLAAETLGGQGLMDAVANFGYGAGYAIAIDTAVSVFPNPAEDADVAAAGIGHGGTLVTPLQQASIAAAIGGGAWLAPTLLENEDPGNARPLEALPDERLMRMMRLVVTDGTGTAADVTGEQVYGKTGTAEWSETDPPHAWFIGYWGELGFAVVVESGGSGGDVAAPIAAGFVEALAGR